MTLGKTNDYLISAGITVERIQWTKYCPLEKFLNYAYFTNANDELIYRIRTGGIKYG